MRANTGHASPVSPVACVGRSKYCNTERRSIMLHFDALLQDGPILSACQQLTLYAYSFPSGRLLPPASLAHEPRLEDRHQRRVLLK